MSKLWQQVALLSIGKSLFLAGVFFILGIPTALAEVAEIPDVYDQQHPTRTVKELLSQGEAQNNQPDVVVQVTAVKANPTDKGVEVILQTPQGEQLQVVNRSADNSYIADIPNAQLRLPNGEAFVFRSQKPLAGITEITVTNFNANTIRVTVTGEAGVPTVELFDSSEEGLIFSVVSAAAATPPQQQPQTQPTPEPVEPGSETAEPDEPEAEGEEEIEILVTGEQETEGYSVPNASTATRTDTPLRDIPQSIQVIPQQVIQDRQPNNLVDALRSVPGISQGQQASTSIYENPIIRGFSAGTDVLRDGVRFPYSTINRFDTATVERIEVLRGPASVLFGQGSLGGVINIITKQPLSEPYYAVEATAGSFNLYRGAIDLSGPLNADKTVLYRLNFAVGSTDRFVDNLYRRDYTIAPTLLWKISDRTDLRLLFEYVNITNANGQFGLPARGTILPNPNGKIRLSTDLNEPSINREETQLFRAGYDLEHRFSETLQFRSIFTADRIEQARSFASPFSLGGDGRTLQRRAIQASNAPIYAVNLTTDNYFINKFFTGSIEHQLLAGFNYVRIDQDYAEKAGSRINISPIDVFNPVYGRPLGTPYAPPFSGEFVSNLYGFYIQDQIALLDNLKLVLGGRFDIADQNIVTNNPSRSSASQTAFTPRVGLVYQPIPPISLYATYVTSFRPTANVFEITTLPEPERGRLYEVGVKADLNDRISTTLAFYDQTRSNISTADPNNPLQTIQVGEQNSRGIEFNIVGEILPRWDVIAGYAYTDARITKDNTFRVGNQVNAVPEDSFNLWTTYRFRDGALEGFGFGLGLFYQDERQGDLANTFQLPNYLRTDAAIFYERDRFRAGLNFRNLFSIEYYESAFNINRVFPGAPLEVQGTVSWKF